LRIGDSAIRVANSYAARAGAPPTSDVSNTS
jgi:hypothetical protein